MENLPPSPTWSPPHQFRPGSHGIEINHWSDMQRLHFSVRIWYFYPSVSGKLFFFFTVKPRFPQRQMLVHHWNSFLLLLSKWPIFLSLTCTASTFQVFLLSIYWLPYLPNLSGLCWTFRFLGSGRIDNLAWGIALKRKIAVPHWNAIKFSAAILRVTIEVERCWSQFTEGMWLYGKWNELRLEGLFPCWNNSLFTPLPQPSPGRLCSETGIALRWLILVTWHSWPMMKSKPGFRSSFTNLEGECFKAAFLTSVHVLG